MSGLSPSVSNRLQASFRDPSGYVFSREGRIYRAINPEFQTVWDELSRNDLLAGLTAKRWLVPTTLISGSLRDTLAVEHPGFEGFLEHERIDPITYPYEWSVSMLADAGILTLDLQLALLERGFSLKDASAYNVQFVAARPVFIDLTSIERPRRMDLWFALGQFHRMFLFPLLLRLHRGWDLRSYFLGSLDGRNVEQVSHSLGWFALWRPSLMLDVTLPFLLERRENRKRGSGQRLDPSSGGGSAEAQMLNLRRLRRKLAKLASGLRPESEWTRYTETCTYDETAEKAKKELVRQFVNSVRPDRVLDLGCNNGDYSFIASECGAKVLAADSDPEVIEQLYRRLRQSPRVITPMVLDLGNPSPAIGFRNLERERFLDRSASDCLLALALAHHLLVSANLTPTNICDLFCDLTRRYAVVEFVPTEDPMFKKLLKFRVNLFEDLSLESFRAAFVKRFEILNEVRIPNSPRTLLFLQKR